MVDIAFPRPTAAPSRWRPGWTVTGTLLMRRRWLLLFTLLFVLGWSAAQVLTMQIKCSTENTYLVLEDGSGYLLTEDDRPLVVDQQRRCDSPWWLRLVPILGL